MTEKFIELLNGIIGFLENSVFMTHPDGWAYEFFMLFVVLFLQLGGALWVFDKEREIREKYSFLEMHIVFSLLMPGILAILFVTTVLNLLRRVEEFLVDVWNDLFITKKQKKRLQKRLERRMNSYARK